VDVHERIILPVGRWYVLSSSSPFAHPHQKGLKNPYNENKPVKISRDGQEVQIEVGFQLCKLIETKGSPDALKSLLEQPIQSTTPVFFFSRAR
jgi:hypothetical protein